MNEYHFYYAGHYFVVFACTVERALQRVKAEYSNTVYQDCIIVKVTPAA